MVNLLVDLHKADAYVDNYPSQFPDDSSRMMLKQSVFAKHGVSQADYDTSLVWYAHNMDTYSDVYRRVIDKLKDEYNHNSNPTDISSRGESSQIKAQAGRSYYSIDGDTADLWTLPRNWILPYGLNTGYIPFDYEPNHENNLGDCYELKYKTIVGQSSLSSLIAVDYSDGGTAYINHKYSSVNWNLLTLQTDSTRIVRRIYGYINYKLSSPNIVYIDSLQLLRTHLNSSFYASRISMPHIVERKLKRSEDTSDKNPATHQIKNEGHFKPKEGLNKPSIKRHIEKSPNANHLPSRL